MPQYCSQLTAACVYIIISRLIEKYDVSFGLQLYKDVLHTEDNDCMNLSLLLRKDKGLKMSYIWIRLL